MQDSRFWHQCYWDSSLLGCNNVLMGMQFRTFSGIFRSLWWREYSPLTYRELLTPRYKVISQQTWIIITQNSATSATWFHHSHALNHWHRSQHPEQYCEQNINCRTVLNCVSQKYVVRLSPGFSWLSIETCGELLGTQ